MNQVLVVDDEADIRALISEILSDEGYGVTVAANAGQARSARSADRFDLVLGFFSSLGVCDVIQRDVSALFS